MLNQYCIKKMILSKNQKKHYHRSIRRCTTINEKKTINKKNELTCVTLAAKNIILNDKNIILMIANFICNPIIKVSKENKLKQKLNQITFIHYGLYYLSSLKKEKSNFKHFVRYNFGDESIKYLNLLIKKYDIHEPHIILKNCNMCFNIRNLDITNIKSIKFDLIDTDFFFPTENKELAKIKFEHLDNVNFIDFIHSKTWFMCKEKYINYVNLIMKQVISIPIEFNYGGINNCHIIGKNIINLLLSKHKEKITVIKIEMNFLYFTNIFPKYSCLRYLPNLHDIYVVWDDHVNLAGGTELFIRNMKYFRKKPLNQLIITMYQPNSLKNIDSFFTKIKRELEFKFFNKISLLVKRMTLRECAEFAGYSYNFELGYIHNETLIKNIIPLLHTKSDVSDIDLFLKTIKYVK
jgi:hypothetical protein